MVNKELLKKAVKKSGFKTEHIVSKLGISRKAFSDKANNKYPFRVAEIYVISDLCGLSDDEQTSIFFASEVN